MKFRFTRGLFKHAAHSPVLGQGLGRHLALHPALLRLVQRFVHACFPRLCCRSPVRGGLVANGSIVQDLCLKTRDKGSEPWVCFPSSPEVTHLLNMSYFRCNSTAEVNTRDVYTHLSWCLSSPLISSPSVSHSRSLCPESPLESLPPSVCTSRCYSSSPGDWGLR